MSLPNEIIPVGLLGTGAADAYQISRSVRLNSADSAYFSRTPSANGNRRTWTFSFWTKRGLGEKALLSVNSTSDSKHVLFRFESDDTLTFYVGYLTSYGCRTTQVFRDPNAWYHIVLAFDASASGSAKVKLYVNGTEVTAFSSDTRSSIADQDWGVNEASIFHVIGRNGTSAATYYDGYLADVHFIDGQALTPSSFGEFDANGVWQPKEFTGEYNISAVDNFTEDTTVHPNVVPKITSGSIDDIYDGNTTNGCQFSPTNGSDTSTFDYPTSLSISRTNVTSVKAYVNGFAAVKTNFQGSYSGTAATGDRTITVYSGSATTLSEISFKSLKDVSDNNRTFTMYALEVTSDLGTEILTNDVDGVNGFHLPFSDNSSAAALGTDTSGAGNDWSVNNISVGSGIDYSAYTSASGGFNASYPKTNLFNGTVTGLNRAEAATVDVPIEIDFSSVPGGVSVSSTLSIWSGKSSVAYQINNSGSYTTYSDAVEAWKDISFSGTLTNLKIKHGAAGQAAGASGIRIDGNVLVDTGRDLDSLVDTPTNYGTDTGAGGEVRGNYATLNPLVLGTATTTNGNLEGTNPGNVRRLRSTIAMSSGKWYWEVVHSSGNAAMIGIIPASSVMTDSLFGTGAGYYGVSGAIYVNGSTSVSGASYANGDVIGLALNLDSNQLSFYKNNSLQQTVSITSGVTWVAQLDQGDSVNAQSYVINFGQRPFAYTAPSGYKALCTTNLDDPLVAQPSTVMDVVTYTGTGTAQTISGLNFSPDFVWFKSRSNAYSHQLYDIIRGTNEALVSNTTASEATYANGLSAFNSDGFTANGDAGTNGNTATYVAWTWDAGSSTVSNTDGSITSQVRANPSAGFSIVSYTGDATNTSWGHGLGAAPKLILFKRRNAVKNWLVLADAGVHSGFTVLEGLNTTAAGSDYSSFASASSTTVTIPNSVDWNENGGTYIAYCFAPVDGYSSFGSYTGNGSTDGPFVYTGFRPRFLLFKCSSAVAYWGIYDAARNTYNAVDLGLYPNDSLAEITDQPFDFLSNGFKVRGSTAFVNSNTATYIYAAFAESPQKYSRAR